jgi:hypothetical protein
LEAHPLQSG